jgi:hypothetical protein
MTTGFELFIEPGEESSTHCACCGNLTRSVWGAVDTAERRVATYFVQWTARSPQHHPHFDFVIGAWGEGARPDDRVLVSLLHRPGPDGGVMVVDGAGRPPDDRALCGRALSREEVMGSPLAANAFALFDVIWLQDERIAELRAWSDPA